MNSSIARATEYGPVIRRNRRSDSTAMAQQLLDLAEQLRQVLVPVKADANYRRRLKGELILAAQQRPQQVESKLPRRRTLIFIGAAALGSLASVVGVIIAFVVRSRHSRTSHIAAG
jgi:hypothetical protein